MYEYVFLLEILTYAYRVLVLSLYVIIGSSEKYMNVMTVRISTRYTY